jgi:hypothetical protein
MSAPIHGIAPEGWPSNMDPAVRRDEFCKAITLYIGNKRLDEALSRAELGQLEGLQRVLALRNGLIANCVRHCRQNPGADATLAVLTLITFMADNNDGICRLSVTRMAQVFGRSERTIYRCIAGLEESGLIGVARNGPKGSSNCYWPTIPAGLAEVGASIVWFADALSHKPKARIFAATTDPESIRKLPPDTTVRGGGVTPDTPVTPPLTQPSGGEAKTPDTTVRAEGGTPDTSRQGTPDAKRQHISLSINSKRDRENVPPTTPNDQGYWGGVLNPQQPQAVVENGKVVLDADVRAEWLERFGGDATELDLSLIQIARFVQENSSRPVIVQVASQLAKIVREKLERDKRYTRAVKSKTEQKTASVESAGDKIRKMAEEAEERQRQKRGVRA